MTKQSPRILFFGNERLSTAFEPQGAPTLEALLAHGYDVAAVISHYEPGRSRKQRALEIEAVANMHNIPVLLPQKMADVYDKLAAFNADCGVLVAFGKMVPQSIIDLFPHGIINIHPSLLPLYRGSTPIEQAILDGVPETGVSLMQLVKEMDAGPVYAQKKVALDGHEEKLALTQKLLQTGGAMLIEHLPAILSGALTPTSQDEAQTTYTSLLTKHDGVLDWAKPAVHLAREVRAFAGWPQTKATIIINNNPFEIIVTQAAAHNTPSLLQGAVEATKQQLYVGTGEGTFEIIRLKVPGKKEIAAGDFIRGYIQ